MFLSEVAAQPAGFFYLVPLVVLLPVAGLLLNILFGKRWGEAGISWVACLASGGAFLVSVLQAVSLLSAHDPVVVPFLEWIHVGSLQIDWSFRVDTLSTTMMLVVSGVGTLIHIFAVGYMHEDVRIQGDPGSYNRFFVYFNLFIASMMILVTGSSYLMLFVGWEGVGLCSYLLIGFWFDKGKDGIGNAIAAKKAFVVNRVGDFGFLIAMFLIFWNFGGLEFNEVFAKVPEISATSPGILMAITIFMLIGVTGKSAQLPLYVWLPDAMAGPTPVSALIHAATMVTAGVYLVARSAPLYSSVPDAQWWVATVGGVTAIFAATIAVGQFDIKKVLAYSTISQLGFMVAAVGSGAYVAGIFHLVTHAFFKALLFLSSGSVILGVEHGLHHVEHDSRLKKGFKAGHHFDPQDMRNMGGLWNRLRTTAVVYLIGALALAGIFPLAGFWSKDEILLAAYDKYAHVFWMLLIAAFFTAFYMTRQIWMVFFGKPRTPPAEHAHDNPPVMTVPLMVLAALSLLGGALNLPFLHSFEHWLDYTLLVGEKTAEGAAAAGGTAETAAQAVTIFNWGGMNLVLAFIVTILALAAIGVGYYFYARRYQLLQELPVARRPDDPLREVIGPVFTAFEKKYWVDELYQKTVVVGYNWLAGFLADVIDWRFWHDFFHDVVIAGGYHFISHTLLAGLVDTRGIDATANGLAKGTQGLAGLLRRLQTGLVRNYALAVITGVVLILGYLSYTILFVSR